MWFKLATPREVLAELGARLRAERLAQFITQADLAAMAGVSVGAIQILERNGRSSMETFVRVAQALGIADQLQKTFTLRRESIKDLRRMEAASRRRRASRKKPA